MKTKGLIGDITISSRWSPAGIQCVTDAAGPQVLTLPTTVDVTSTLFCTLQSTVTTWNFSDVTSVSPTAANTQVINPNLPPMIYVGPLNKLQFWCTTANAKLLVHYYK